MAAVFLAGTALPAWAQLTANGTPDNGTSNNGNPNNGSSGNGAAGNGAPANGVPGNGVGGAPKQSINMNYNQIKAQAPINGGNIAAGGTLGETTQQSGSSLPQMRQAPSSSVAVTVSNPNPLGATVQKAGFTGTIKKGKSKGSLTTKGSNLKITKSALPSMKQAGSASASAPVYNQNHLGETAPHPVLAVPGNNNPPPPH